MATVAATPTSATPAQQTGQKKPFSDYIGVDEAAAGNGLASDLATVAALRKAAKNATSSTDANTPKV